MPYKPKSRPAANLLKLGQDQHPSSYWYLIGKIENYRTKPGFSGRQNQYLFVDKNEDALYPLAKLMGLDPETHIESFFGDKGVMYGISLSNEEEIELWQTTFNDFQNTYFQQSIRKWFAKLPVGLPEKETGRSLSA